MSIITVSLTWIIDQIQVGRHVEKRGQPASLSDWPVCLHVLHLGHVIVGGNCAMAGKCVPFFLGMFSSVICW